MQGNTNYLARGTITYAGTTYTTDLGFDVTQEILAQANKELLINQIIAAQEALEEARQQHAAELSRVEEEYQAKADRLFIKMYAEAKIRLSGMTFTESSRALLEECNSIEDVDDVYAGIIDAVRSSALHSDLPETVVVENKEDPAPIERTQNDEIHERVGSAIKGMKG